jgi:Ca2+-transporting ATPase
MKALLALGVLGLVPWLGYGVDVTRATAFHVMAIGQLVLTYPARRAWTVPRSNPVLHLAVAGGVALQLLAAWLPLTTTLLGQAAIPAPLWLLVLAAAGLAWALAELIARAAWRRPGPA